MLEKPKKDKSAIELLTKKEFIEKTEWKYTLIDNARLILALSSAPAGTSYGENMLQDYYHIPYTYWKVLKMLNKDSEKVKERLLEGLD